MNSIDNLREFPASALVLLLAASLDYLLGDPRGWLHPVQVMGWGISSYTQLVLNRWPNHLARRLAGIGLGVGAIVASGLVGWLIVQAASRIHPWFGIGIEAIVLASCLAGRSLRTAAIDVLQPLSAADVDKARSRLNQYVGRDTENLSFEDIHRAVVETIAENTTDGVTAPLFYALIGAFIPGVGTLPLALAYKAASTLDSMVGYQREPFTDLGWFSAQIEDLLTFVPCRLTVLTLALTSGAPQQVWHLCRRDAVKDPSPNAGWSECAFAAILGVQLGGTNRYGGVVKHKPLLGEPRQPITSVQVHQALRLTRNCFLVWLGIGLVGLLLEKLV